MAFRKPAPQYDPRPGKDTAESKDIANNSLAFLTHAMPTRHRSGSTASTRSNKSTHNNDNKTTSMPLNPTLVNNSNSNSTALLPPLLPRNSSDNNSTHSKQSHHHHIRLPSFLRRRKHSAPESSSSSPSSTPASSTVQLSLQQHTIVMVSQHDIHITWPHPVPSGNAYIAGTWSVPGHGPWEKLPMTRIPGTDSFEVHLDVQEIEDISDYLDEDGYLHHELLDHHHAHDHTQQGSPPLTPTSTTSSTLSRRKRLSRFFGRARSSSSASTTSTTTTSTTTTTTASKDLQIDFPHHHQSKDGTFLPLAREYRYQFKFVIDDEWKCDHDRPQVQDPHGHWNHELVVELVEQTPPDVAGSRSRSSSLQSQHGPQLGEHSPLNKSLPTPHPTVITTTSGPSTTAAIAIDTPTSIIISPAEEDEKREEEIKEEIPRQTTENVAVSTPVPASSSVTVSAPIAPAMPALTTITTTKSRDTFEAVLIFDETDDLSDGEGRPKHRAQVESDDDDSDEEDVKEEEGEETIEVTNNIDTDNNNNSATELLGEDVVKAKANVTPQQDDHAALSPADQDDYPLGEEFSAVIRVSAAEAVDDDATPASASFVQAVVSSDITVPTEETAAASVPEVNSIEEVVAQAVEEKKKVAVEVEEEEEEEEEEESVTAAIEDVFVNSSSVADSLPQLDEPSIIINAESIAVEEEEEEQETVAPVPIVVEEAKVEPEAETEMVTAVERTLAVEAEEAPAFTLEEVKLEPEAEVEEEETPAPAPAPVDLSPAPGSVVIPASPVFSFSSATANSHLLSPDVESEAFVLQAAVNLEEDLSKDDSDVSEAEELESTIQEAKPVAATAVLEVVADAAAVAATTAVAAATIATVAAVATTATPLSVTTTADYSQVPSPPLTPSNLTSSKRDLIAEHITSVETEIESAKQQQEETFERTVCMTPRAETTFTKHTTLEETTTTATAVEDENATIDILEDKDLPASLLSSSSSTSSLSTLNGGNNIRRSSNSSTSTKHNSAHMLSSEEKSREVVEHHDKKKSLPEQYPNLFWSICKTTAVVSTAVVILTLGLGRKRD